MVDLTPPKRVAEVLYPVLIHGTSTDCKAELTIGLLPSTPAGMSLAYDDVRSQHSRWNIPYRTYGSMVGPCELLEGWVGRAWLC